MSMSYSYSSLNSFRNCPRQFKFNKIDKVQKAATVGAELYLGSAVHKALENIYKRAANKKVMSLEDVLKIYHEFWDKIDPGIIKVVSNDMGVDDYIKSGEEMLVNHYEKYQPFDQGKVYGAEIPLSFTLPGTNFRINTKIDLLMVYEGKKVEIVDFKTGKKLSKKGDMNFLRQMGLYQLAIQKNYPMLENITVSQNYLWFPEIVSEIINPDQMEILIEDIKQDIFDIQDAIKFDNFPTKETPLCNYCDYFQLCPAQRHKIFLENDGEEVDNQKLAYEKATEFIYKTIQLKSLKDEINALKDDLDKLSEELELTKFEGDGGSVKVTRKVDEKFITKTKSQTEFADLSYLARELGLEDFFTLDARSLMKEIYKKNRLEPEQMEKLGQFIITEESVRFTPKVNKDYNPED